MRRTYRMTQSWNETVKKPSLTEDGTWLTAEHALWKPAERMAVRALYALGLDRGQVELCLDDNGKLNVVKLTGEIAGQDSVADAAEHAVLGADPEFVLFSTAGRIVPASRFFMPDGAAGCDSIRVRGEKIWPLVELRPTPSRDPGKVASDVRRLLRVAAERTAGTALIWRAGALPVPGLPLGGHIHISGVPLTNERIRALDNAVALPLRLLEPPSAARRRPRYGSLGDVRRQPHGGFEYRTPPSWLVSPLLAYGALALAKVAAEHSRELSHHRPLDEEICRDAFYEGNRAILLTAMDKVRYAITGTTAYRHYQKPIHAIFTAIERGRMWDEEKDIRLKWRIGSK